MPPWRAVVHDIRSMALSAPPGSARVKSLFVACRKARLPSSGSDSSPARASATPSTVPEPPIGIQRVRVALISFTQRDRRVRPLQSPSQRNAIRIVPLAMAHTSKAHPLTLQAIAAHEMTVEVLNKLCCPELAGRTVLAGRWMIAAKPHCVMSGFESGTPRGTHDNSDHRGVLLDGISGPRIGMHDKAIQRLLVTRHIRSRRIPLEWGVQGTCISGPSAGWVVAVAPCGHRQTDAEVACDCPAFGPTPRR
jgi:hypothetical protein